MSASRYRITVRGVLDGRWSAYFPGMTVAARPVGLTEITGDADQSALHGILSKIRDMNVQIVSVVLLD
jgi:hypothetical protein